MLSKRWRLLEFLRNHSGQFDSGIRMGVSFFGNLIFGIGVVWKAARSTLILRIVVNVLMSVLPVLQLWILKELIDTLSQGVESSDPGLVIYRLVWFVAFQALASILASVLTRIDQAATGIVSDLLVNHLTIDVMRKASSFDLSFFDSPELYNEIANSERDMVAVPRMLDFGMQMAQAVLRGIVTAGILATLHWSLPVIFIVVSIPFAISERHFIVQADRWQRFHAAQIRKMRYCRNVLTTQDYAKEVRLFGLASEMVSRYSDLWSEWFMGRYKMITKHTCSASMSSVIPQVLSASTIMYVGIGVLYSRFSLGMFSFYSGAVGQMYNNVYWVVRNVMFILDGQIKVANLRKFLSWQSDYKTSGEVIPSYGKGGHTIEFRDVTFRYPGMKTDVLRKVNFTIFSGERVALVGLNGAGKSTIVKLMLRLYDTTEGQVLIDGIDVQEYDLEKLRRLFGVVFQDFCHYAFTARENVGLSRLDHIGDDARLMGACSKSGADRVLSKLPKGLETYLTRGFEEEGAELSGGEWQKLALARAFFADSDILVLDEPTSNLDPQTEHEIFEGFAGLSEGKEALLISHRLSSVTMADRILVLEGGEIVESGQHKELMQRGGKYARLFTLQAERYRMSERGMAR